MNIFLKPYCRKIFPKTVYFSPILPPKWATTRMYDHRNDNEFRFNTIENSEWKPLASVPANVR